METKSKTKKIVLIMIVISILLIALVSVSFVLFLQKQRDNVKEVVKTSVVSMTYSATTNGLILTNLTPMNDETGKNSRDEGSYFDFAVTSETDSNTKVEYEIALVKDDASTIPDSDIMVYLERQSSGTYSKVDDPSAFTPRKKKSSLGSPAKSMVLDKVSLSSNRIDNYRLRIWVREGAIITDPAATYTVRVKVYGKAVD